MLMLGGGGGEMLSEEASHGGGNPACFLSLPTRQLRFVIFCWRSWNYPMPFRILVLMSHWSPLGTLTP